MRFILTLLCLIFTSISPAFANLNAIKMDVSIRELDSWKSQIATYTNSYDEILREIYKKPSKLDDKLPLLRSYYPRTRQYSPFSKDILDEITQHALILDTASDNQVINEALHSYKTLINKHLMNFDVASFALTMSRIDVRFGDEIFYKRVRDALIKNIYREGMGKTPETAHRIVSYGEETYILDQIGGKIDHSEIFEINGIYYNVHELTTKDGVYRQVFMNVTEPIKNIFYTQIIKEREENVSLSPQ